VPSQEARKLTPQRKKQQVVAFRDSSECSSSTANQKGGNQAVCAFIVWHLYVCTVGDGVIVVGCVSAAGAIKQQKGQTGAGPYQGVGMRCQAGSDV